MKNQNDLLYKFFICIMACAIPALLAAAGVQAHKYLTLEREVSDLENKEEKLVEDNKRLITEISTLSSSDRIEKIASGELGMHKAQSSDIIRVVVGAGKK